MRCSNGFTQLKDRNGWFNWKHSHMVKKSVPANGAGRGSTEERTKYFSDVLNSKDGFETWSQIQSSRKPCHHMYTVLEYMAIYTKFFSQHTQGPFSSLWLSPCLLQQLYVICTTIHDTCSYILMCYIDICTLIPNIHFISYTQRFHLRECGQTQKMLKVKICTYFNDLGLPKSFRGGEFCCNNYCNVLCACLRKKQQPDRCLRPGQRTANATVLQSTLLAWHPLLPGSYG